MHGPKIEHHRRRRVERGHGLRRGNEQLAESGAQAEAVVAGVARRERVDRRWLRAGPGVNRPDRPNAIPGRRGAVRARGHRGHPRAVFGRRVAGVSASAASDMVDEVEVSRLHRTLRVGLDRATVREVTRNAGVRTARYLLARRIPRVVQALLKVLPAPWRRACCCRPSVAMRGPSPAAACSPRSQVGRRPDAAGHPLCRGVSDDEPVCSYYAATFEHLFRVLVHPQARVVETAARPARPALPVRGGLADSPG